MVRKPDVFQIMIFDVVKYHDPGWKDKMTTAQALMLLRRYHARVRRMVAVYAKTYPVAAEMLENLDRMKKGTR
jgi:hypothetical protein